ncbi:MAG: hypothetical protein COA74_12890 [Gammaproteobacteria bacterium]|nr:MAG: hypothetical protein COA74_12890 [Gammaproteobacteria bacterium]
MGVQNMFKFISQVILLSIAMFALNSIDAKAKLPEKKFVCHVSTSNGFDGLVFMQAHDLEDAIQGASSTQAYTTNGSMANSKEVRQCIKPSKETFSDYQLQQFYESMSEEFK